ncbi:MAG TPA: hypothetical protein VK605_07650, partial [Solirubrobacteraceae bacterium]|nr:hypothetical protein [Solirubrobacteraceae bacterium]
MTQTYAIGARRRTMHGAVLARAASVSIFLLLVIGCLAGIGAQRADASKGRVLVVAQPQISRAGQLTATYLRSLGYPVTVTSSLPEQPAEFSA